ncbi:MAG: tetratricopeptide repeat protein [Sandaracinaceae bacterium]
MLRSSRNRAWIGGGLIVVGLLAAWAFGSARHDDEATEPPLDVSLDASPPDPAPRPVAGDEAARARLNAGIEHIEQHVDDRADDWMILQRLAGGYLERQRLTGDWADFGRAEAALERAFERAPEGAGPYLMRANLRYTLHRFDAIEPDLQAIEAFAVRRDENVRGVRMMRANIAVQTGHYEEGREQLEALLAESRQQDALLGLTGYHMATGGLEQADALLTEAEDLASGSDGMTRAWLCLARGLVQLEAQDYDAAIAHYERGLTHLPGWYLLEEHIAEARAERGEVDTALTMYDALIERTNDPEFMDAAAGLLATRDPDRARALYARAHEGHEARIAAFPTAAFGHALDHFLEHEGDADRAVQLAENNRDIRPNGEAWMKLAHAYHLVGREADARRALDTVEAMPYRSHALEEVRADILGTD